jgi:hypothetical protein
MPPPFFYCRASVSDAFSRPTGNMPVFRRPTTEPTTVPPLLMNDAFSAVVVTGGATFQVAQCRLQTNPTAGRQLFLATNAMTKC